MTDPFILHEDSINDRTIQETETVRWVEGTLHKDSSFEFLKPSLRKSRFAIVVLLSVAVLFVFLARGAQLQVGKRDYYRGASDANRMRIVRITAPRGTIVDREGVALTVNRPRFQVILNPLDLPRDQAAKQAILKRIAPLVEIPLETLIAQSDISKLPVAPVILKSGVQLADVYPLILKSQDIPAIALETVPSHEYPYGPLMAHVLGYLGKISEEQKQEYGARGYAFNDLVGKTGLEAQFEDTLRGKDGKKYVEITATGKMHDTIAEEASVPGAMLPLTLDLALQKKATELLTDTLKAIHKTKGSIVAIDPHDGGILALVSLPSFDNNLFTGGKDAAPALQALLTDPDRPLYFRAIAGTYPSGSTVKPAVAAAALQEHVVTPKTTVLSVGGIHVGQWFFPDWRAGGHGVVNVISAIANSVNTFFYTVGGGYGDIQGLGVDRLAQYLRKFAFGTPSGIDLPGEASGLVPDAQWKQEQKHEQWYIGDTYHLAIGQGDFLATPLQIARMTLYFATSGKWLTPHVVQATKGEAAGGPGIDPEHVQTVREGMRATITAGSAKSLQSLPVTSAGKTGTAQWAVGKPPHAWFTGWAPYENPEIVVTVLVEEGNEGSTVSVPIAKEMIRFWMEHLKNEPIHNAQNAVSR